MGTQLQELRQLASRAENRRTETGIPRVAISGIENGKRKVDALELEALARVYKYPVAYFLDGALETTHSIKSSGVPKESQTGPNSIKSTFIL